MTETGGFWATEVSLQATNAAERRSGGRAANVRIHTAGNTRRRTVERSVVQEDERYKCTVGESH